MSKIRYVKLDTSHYCKCTIIIGKGICLVSRYPCDYTFFRLYLLWQWAHSSLQLHGLIQPWICAPGTRYRWVDWGRVEYEVCPTLLHGQHWESKPRPSDLESNALSTWPHAPLLSPNDYSYPKIHSVNGSYRNINRPSNTSLIAFISVAWNSQVRTPAVTKHAFAVYVHILLSLQGSL